MDIIKFIIEDYVDEEHGFQLPTINIYINNINLIALVEQVEFGYRFPLQTGETVQQSYIGLNPGYHRDFRNQFLGQITTPFSILLTCTCQEEMCNSILAKIDTDSKMVTWSKIRSPFLGSGKSWKDDEGIERFPIDYSGLGPFIFSKEQYMNALDSI